MSDSGERIVEKPSWVQRLGSSFKGVLTGFGLFIAGIILLFWNEGRAVDTAQRLKEGAAAVVEVSADQIDPANEGKLVHVSGKADTKDILSDDVFGISDNALRLQRTVEIFQTVEHIEKKDEGNKVREIPRYENAWCDKPVDSSGFRNESMRGANPPPARLFANESKIAPNVTLGAFKLSEEHVNKVSLSDFTFQTNYVAPKGMEYETGSKYVYIPVDPVAALGSSATSSAEGSPLLAQQVASRVAQAVVGRSVATRPKPGDLRVSFKVAKPCEVSIIQGQKGNALVRWTTPKGKELPLMFSKGTVPASTMFANAQSSNSTLTWILRFVGILVMYFGLKGVLGPLDALVDVIPILNRIVAMGTSLAAALVAGACGLLTIGISWIYHRPWVGIPLVLGGVGLLVMVFLKKKKSGTAVA